MRLLLALALLLPALVLAGPRGGSHGSSHTGSSSSSHSSKAAPHHTGASHSGGHSSSSTHSTPANTHHKPTSHHLSTGHTSAPKHATKIPAGSVKRDSHGRIERSAAAKDSFKKDHACPSTGKTSGACPGYEVDHVKPLACGGADAPGNMQWLTKAANRSKGAEGCKSR